VSVLEAKQARRTYGRRVALHGFDLCIERGEVVALLGPNGAGKSTVFDLLLGLIAPSEGRITVFGERPHAGMRTRVGAMLQDAGLPEQYRVGELVRLVARSYPKAHPVDETLDRVGLAPRRRQSVATLSGGERQRLLLALATVGGPELLLLDEPTSAMDVESRRSFWEQTLSAVERGATLLFATHDLAEADAVADRVVLLHEGRMIADATPAKLKQLVPSCLVTVATDAPGATIGSWSGVKRVQPAAPGKGVTPEGLALVTVSAADAGQVVVPLVKAGYQVEQLTIVDADLEAAFMHLTRGGSTDRLPIPVPAQPGVLR
jgi:ABC-2 type transport system ATP-binding protein